MTNSTTTTPYDGDPTAPLTLRPHPGIEAIERYHEEFAEAFPDTTVHGCRRHPDQVTGNGAFDAPCGRCEMEMNEN